MRQLKNYDTKEKKQIKSTKKQTPREKSKQNFFWKGHRYRRKMMIPAHKCEPTNHNEVNSQSDLLLLLTNISIFNVDNFFPNETNNTENCAFCVNLRAEIIWCCCCSHFVAALCVWKINRHFMMKINKRGAVLENIFYVQRMVFTKRRNNKTPWIHCFVAALFRLCA